MKKVFFLRAGALLAAGIFILSFACGCSDSIDSVLTNYNSGYKTEVQLKNSTSDLSPGEEGFSEEDMLKAVYYVSTKETLNLFAPQNCASYKWNLLEVETVETLYSVRTVERAVSYNLSNGSSDSSRSFMLYVPDSGLEQGTYKLILTVTDKEGKEYNDTTSIVVYQL